ncbi:hypothetical protein [Rubripirellula reticaptiva]|uniref:Uncharacterized protein n=1 Tax=Rubripirellula reticaptiva TaxID=2528013 RepID=A0A5C6ETW8_9BACT|nr:hypothetical protein [Rubripirellula reticaptiva]TWU51527.1 hypothetical protein Poly59_31190 [Rubripirellula reticaptiva]
MSAANSVELRTAKVLTTAGVMGGLICGSIGTFLQWSYQTGVAWSVARWLPIVLFAIGLLLLIGCVRSIRNKEPGMVSYAWGLFAVALLVCPSGVLWWEAFTNPEILRDLPILDKIIG